MNEDGEMRIGL